MDQSPRNEKRTIKASEFKAKCLSLIDSVRDTGEEIVISKRGKPLARLVPYQDIPKSTFGIDKDILHILGDIEAPLNVKWKAMQDDTKLDY